MSVACCLHFILYNCCRKRLSTRIFLLCFFFFQIFFSYFKLVTQIVIYTVKDKELLLFFVSLCVSFFLSFFFVCLFLSYLKKKVSLSDRPPWARTDVLLRRISKQTPPPSTEVSSTATVVGIYPNPIRSWCAAINQSTPIVTQGRLQPNTPPAEKGILSPCRLTGCLVGFAPDTANSTTATPSLASEFLVFIE